MRKRTGLILASSLVMLCMVLTGAMAEQPGSNLPAPPIPAVTEVATATPNLYPVAEKQEVKPFGYDFFASAPVSFTIAPDAPVTDSYIYDNNDRVRIRYWAPSVPEVSYELRVNDNGMVTLPGIGDIRAAGYTKTQFREKVGARIAEQIKNPSFTAELIETRTIVVFVTGAARRPGRYTLKAESNLFNVIYAAGGASEDGTLRKITVIRKGGTVATTDIYKFLINGMTDREIMLKDQDTIFFPIAGPRVTIKGQVVRPAIYEVTDKNNISDVLTMAGGLKPSAYSRIVRLQRIEDGRRVERTIDANAIAAGSPKKEDIALRDGDVLTVENVSGRIRDRVSIRGYVTYPGDYSIMRTPTAKALLTEAKLRTGAYQQRADLMRVLDDGTPVVVPIPLQTLFDGTTKDIDLMDQDEVVVYGNDEKSIVPLVTIEGPVRNPASYRLADGMKAGDLIFAAGGLLQDASREVAHLYRRTGPNSFKMLRIIPSDAAGDESTNPVLKDQDKLVVYKQKEVEFKRNKVNVLGEVQKPGEFMFYDGMTLYDLIIQAGGPTDMAAGTVEVTKASADSDESKLASVKSVSIVDVMSGADKNDPVEAGMLISLPRKQEKIIEPRRVELKGQFKRPGVYALLTEGETLDSLIQRAGGLAENSDPFGISFTRRSDQMLSAATAEQVKTVLQTMDQLLPADVNAQNNQGNTSADVVSTTSPLTKLSGMSGSRLNENLLLVSPRRLTGMPTGKRISFTLEDRSSYVSRIGKMKLADGDIIEVPKLSNVVQVLGAVQSPGPVFFASGLTANNYIDRAGGGAPDADIRRAVVIKVSGAVQPINRTKLIDPGDVIVVASKYQAIQPPGQRTTADTIADLLGVALVIRGLR